MRATRLFPGLALLLVATTAGAQPDARALPAPPARASVEIVRAAPGLAAAIEARAGAIAACVPTNRTQVKTRVYLRWSDRGTVVASVVTGGTAAYNACVRRAVRGALDVTRRGSGVVQLIARAPAKPTPKPPTITTAHPELVACKVDSDCTLHFQLSACVPSDPIAVNTSNPTAVRTAFPVRRLECAMGGPQYERLRMSSENRYSTRCVQKQCALIDAGPSTDPFGKDDGL